MKTLFLILLITLTIGCHGKEKTKCEKFDTDSKWAIKAYVGDNCGGAKAGQDSGSDTRGCHKLKRPARSFSSVGRGNCYIAVWESNDCGKADGNIHDATYNTTRSSGSLVFLASDVVRWVIKKDLLTVGVDKHDKPVVKDKRVRSYRTDCSAKCMGAPANCDPWDPEYIFYGTGH
jgi:hypothetical protein